MENPARGTVIVMMMTQFIPLWLGSAPKNVSSNRGRQILRCCRLPTNENIVHMIFPMHQPSCWTKTCMACMTSLVHLWSEKLWWKVQKSHIEQTIEDQTLTELLTGNLECVLVGAQHPFNTRCELPITPTQGNGKLVGQPFKTNTVEIWCQEYPRILQTNSHTEHWDSGLIEIPIFILVGGTGTKVTITVSRGCQSHCSRMWGKCPTSSENAA